ncbi:MAG: hypothetical protein PHI79_01260 [Sulfurovaceae bacterium]|nr:hypothetical protein [Sulfurovaceae bacterium]MDD5548203.1 hypothetical protein [Sulfurovaceae bacterium]
MNILEQLETSTNSKILNFYIDTIRIEFSLQYKQKSLENLGKWHKLKKSDFKYNQIKKRLSLTELSTVYQLEDYNIYYYKRKDKQNRKKAIMVIFGLKQYHKDPPPRELISQIVDTLTYKVDFKKYRDFEIDLSFDTPIAPNYENLSKHYTTKILSSNRGTTCYINSPNLLMIRSVCIYDKASKNSLATPLYRYEATIHIPNPKELNLPIDDFIEIINKGMKQ